MFVSWGFRKWQRSSFWLQYGRLRKHLQACDVLLEQINACAALPGRPKLEIPAGISREVRITHCEIPSHVTPESPFDAALNLSFGIPRAVSLSQDSTDRLKLSDPQIPSPSSEDCSSLPGSKNSESQSLPKSESQVFSSVSQSSHVQPPDSGKVTGGCPDIAFNDPVVCCSESELKPMHPCSKVSPVACISEREDRVSKCSGSSARETQLRPINFISASYYVERPSNPQSFSLSNTTRRTSFCRIEAFVIRIPRAVSLSQDCTDRLKLSDPQIPSPSSEDCSSLPGSKNSESQSLPKSESQVFSSVSQSSHVQPPDSGKVTGGCPDIAFNDPVVCCSESELKPMHPCSKVSPVACISEREDRVSKCSGSSARETQLRPINFISASYYVERPSNPQSFSLSNTTRRTSFCRIEAFVIRSKSVKSIPQSRIGVPQFKK